MDKKQRNWNLIILSLLLFPLLGPPIFKELNFRIRSALCFGFGEDQLLKKISVAARAFDDDESALNCASLLYKDLNRRGFFDDKRSEEDKLLDNTYYSPSPKKIEWENFTYEKSVAYDNALESKNDFKVGNLKEAFDKIQIAIQNNPKSEYFHQRADIYFKWGAYRAALRDYDKAWDQENMNKVSKAELFYKEGLCLYKLENYSKAMDYFTSAINMNPRRADYFYNRGLARNKLGYGEFAQLDFRKATELSQ
mgnify:FL=1